MHFQWQEFHNIQPTTSPDHSALGSQHSDQSLLRQGQESYIVLDAAMSDENTPPTRSCPQVEEMDSNFSSLSAPETYAFKRQPLIRPSLEMKALFLGCPLARCDDATAAS